MERLSKRKKQVSVVETPARTSVGTTSRVRQASTDIYAEHLLVVTVIVHSVTSHLRQGAEIKQMTCRTEIMEV